MVKQLNHLPRLAWQRVPQSGSKSRPGLRIRRDRKVIVSSCCLTVASDWSPPTSVSLQDLGGIDDCLQEVLELIVMPLKHPEIYTHTGIQPPRYISIFKYDLILGVFYFTVLRGVGKHFWQMPWRG